MAEMSNVSLKEYVDAKFCAVENARKDALSAMEHRLAGMNEFRETLREQANKFLTREEYSIAHKALEADIRMLRESKAMLEGKASQGAVTLSTGLAVFGILLAIILHFI
jgi:hypothetical protein